MITFWLLAGFVVQNRCQTHGFVQVFGFWLFCPACYFLQNRTEIWTVASLFVKIWPQRHLQNETPNGRPNPQNLTNVSQNPIGGHFGDSLFAISFSIHFDADPGRDLRFQVVAIGPPRGFQADTPKSQILIVFRIAFVHFFDPPKTRGNAPKPISRARPPPAPQQ